MSTSQLEGSSPPQLPLTIDAIDSGIAVVEAKSGPDKKDKLEREDLELDGIRLKNLLAKSQIKNVKADRRMRKTYAARILKYLEIYSLGVGFLVLLHGSHFKNFSLEENILAALVGSTAVAAIGLVGFIAKGLFRPPPDQNSN